MTKPRGCAWIAAGLIVAGAGAPAVAQQSRPAPPANTLRIVVIAGEDAVNIIQQKTAVAPVVEVRDRNNQPVAGVIVTFTIEGGRNATFAAGANTLTATTNALGQAAVTGIAPTGAGAVQINVAAAFQGQTATAAITQTNFATAAQAASASSGSGASAGAAGGGGGGLGVGAITGIAAGAVGIAGGLYGYQRLAEDAGDPPVVSDVTASPPKGVQGSTPIFLGFSGTSHDGTEYVYDFGDGTRISQGPLGGGPEPHVYQSAGTFTLTVTIHDKAGRTASGRASVLIESLTGRWNTGGSFFNLVQSGSSITGTFTSASGQGSGTVSGTLTPFLLNQPGNQVNLRLTITPSGPGPSGSFAGTPSLAGDVIVGTLTIGSTTSTVTLRR